MGKKKFYFSSQLDPTASIQQHLVCVLPFFLLSFLQMCLLSAPCVIYPYLDGFFSFFLSFGESIWVLILFALSPKMSLLVLPKHKMSSQVASVKVYCLSTTCSKLRLQKISYIINKFSKLGLRYWGVISR